MRHLLFQIFSMPTKKTGRSWARQRTYARHPYGRTTQHKRAAAKRSTTPQASRRGAAAKKPPPPTPGPVLHGERIPPHFAAIGHRPTDRRIAEAGNPRALRRAGDGRESAGHRPGSGNTATLDPNRTNLPFCRLGGSYGSIISTPKPRPRMQGVASLPSTARPAAKHPRLAYASSKSSNRK